MPDVAIRPVRGRRPRSRGVGLRRAAGGAAVAAVVVVGLAGCQPPPAPPAPQPLTVPVAHPVTKTIVEWDRYQGRLAAVEEVEIQAKISGYLKQVQFKDGQTVEAGQLLFEIDQRPFKTDLARANASLDTARARFREAEAQAKVAQVGRTEAQADLTLAEANYERVQGLRGTGGLSVEAIDTRANEVFQAKARVASAEASIAAADAAVETAKAEIATAEANLHTAEVQFGYTTIESPIAGRVGRRMVSPGDLIVGGGQGATMLTDVVSVSPIHVYFDIDQARYEDYDALARSGSRPSSRAVHNPIYVALDSDSKFEHLGHMDFVDNRLDQATATMTGRAVLLNPDGRFQPGQFVRLRLPGSAPTSVVLIPDSAITSDQSDRVVYVLGEGNKVEPRKVVTGEISHGLRIVRENLTSEDRILLAGLTRVRPGDVVTPDESAEIAVADSELPDAFEPLAEDQFVQRYGQAAVVAPPMPESPTEPLSTGPGPEAPAADGPTTSGPTTSGPVAAGPAPPTDAAVTTATP